MTSVEKIQHNPTVKNELQDKKKISKEFKVSTPLGFFVYPVHQAADIMTVNADLVPVGEDQLPMIELTRDIVQKFNNLYHDYGRTQNYFHLSNSATDLFFLLFAIR